MLLVRLYGKSYAWRSFAVLRMTERKLSGA